MLTMVLTVGIPSGLISGRFDDVSLLSVVNVLAHRVGSNVVDVGGMYTLSVYKLHFSLF